MAGQTYMFQVLAGASGGGWSAPSEGAAAMTVDSSLSEQCKDQLAAQAQGQYLTTGAIVGIVIAVFAALLLLGILLFMLRRRTPPPPPSDPEYKQ